MKKKSRLQKNIDYLKGYDEGFNYALGFVKSMDVDQFMKELKEYETSK